MNCKQGHQVLRAFGHEAHVLVSSEEAGGACCVIRMFASPGYDVPLHNHRYEDEMFIVESGELEVYRGGEIIRARKGDVVFLPKNIPHAPRVVGTEQLQVLITCVPGGFDHYLAACAEEWSKPEPDLQYLNEIAAKFGQEFHLEPKFHLEPDKVKRGPRPVRVNAK